MKDMGLVTNQTATDPKPQIQSLILNLLPTSVRNDTLEGRPHVVVPMVMITEGVHNGSAGPIYYPPDELCKTPAAWDHKPVVVYHPEMNGRGISACRPDVINNQKIGVILNTKWENGRLVAEAWIEEVRANAVDKRIMEAIGKGDMMELSTGLFSDDEEKKGVWNGEDYIKIARNYRPDHLAVLPDQIGACSTRDGAGFLRNQSVTKQMWKLLRNAMSFDQIRSQLRHALIKRLNILADECGIYTEDVYPTFVIYCHDDKLFRLSYTSNETGITLGGENPVEVKRVTEYRTVEGAVTGNQDQKKETNDMDKKKEMVDAIIGNKDSGWSETDRTRLMAFNETQLSRLKGEDAASAPKTETQAPATNATPVTPATPAPAKTPTVEEYIANAPREIQASLRRNMAADKRERERLISVIKANKRNKFDDVALNGMEIDQLANLAELAADESTPAMNAVYGGQGGQTSTGSSKEAPMALSQMDYRK